MNANDIRTRIDQQERGLEQIEQEIRKATECLQRAQYRHSVQQGGILTLKDLLKHEEAEEEKTTDSTPDTCEEEPTNPGS